MNDRYHVFLIFFIIENYQFAVFILDLKFLPLNFQKKHASYLVLGRVQKSYATFQCLNRHSFQKQFALQEVVREAVFDHTQVKADSVIEVTKQLICVPFQPFLHMRYDNFHDFEGMVVQGCTSVTQTLTLYSFPPITWQSCMICCPYFHDEWPHHTLYRQRPPRHLSIVASVHAQIDQLMHLWNCLRKLHHTLIWSHLLVYTLPCLHQERL